LRNLSRSILTETRNNLNLRLQKNHRQKEDGQSLFHLLGERLRVSVNPVFATDLPRLYRDATALVVQGEFAVKAFQLHPPGRLVQFGNGNDLPINRTDADGSSVFGINHRIITGDSFQGGRQKDSAAGMGDGQQVRTRCVKSRGNQSTDIEMNFHGWDTVDRSLESLPMTSQNLIQHCERVMKLLREIRWRTWLTVGEAG